MKYFLGFLVAVGLLVGVFLLVLNGFKSDKPKTTATPLVEYASTDREMRYTMRGHISADTSHHAIRITVGRNLTTIDVIQGYNEETIKTQSYANNQSAYAEFLRALDLAGYTRGVPNPELQDDRGYCATGQRYVMEILDRADTVQHYWTTTCGKGNFKGNANQVKTLFIKQVPDYNVVTQGIIL